MMAIKDIISPGIGFTPGSVEFIVTRGLGAGAVVGGGTRRQRQIKSLIRSARRRAAILLPLLLPWLTAEG